MQSRGEGSSSRKAARRALFRAAATLERVSRRRKRRLSAPSVFFVTDPDRVPDPCWEAGGLPPGTGIIFRAFGRPGALETAKALVRIAHRRKLTVLVGASEELALASGADGVHLPERDLWRARGIRRRHPRWLVTGAAHSASALARAGEVGVQAALLSSVFPSKSPSAGRALGPIRLAILVRGARLPVYALGGVAGARAKRLIGTGVQGLAAVEGLTSASRRGAPDGAG